MTDPSDPPFPLLDDIFDYGFVDEETGVHMDGYIVPKDDDALAELLDDEPADRYADFVEEDHPRDEKGRFGEGGGGGGHHAFADGKEADAWGLATYEGYKEPPRKRKDGTVKETPGKGGLSLPESQLLRSYALTGYAPINEMLRGPGPQHWREKEWVTTIDGVMSRNKTDRALVVYRSAASPELLALYDKAAAGQTGSVIEDKAYVSTGLVKAGGPARRYGDERRADKVLMEIKVPKGTPSMALEHVGNAREHELLLPRGSRFKVTGAREEGGRKWLTVEWVGHGEGDGNG
jgi:hypothetical protein